MCFPIIVCIAKLSVDRFPADDELKKRWIVMIGRKQADGKLWQPSKTSCLCSKHFLETDYECHFGQKKLKADAVPSIFCHRPEPCKRKRPSERLHPAPKRQRFDADLVTSTADCDNTVGEISVPDVPVCSAKSTLTNIHNYALLSPRKLSAKLRRVVKLASDYKKKLHNARRRERRLRGKVENLLTKLKENQLLTTKAEEMIQTYSGLYK